MQRFNLFYTQNWYITMPIWQKELVRVALELYAREERMHSAFADYSFLVFPMAKAYEGFLKKYFFDNGLISHQMYIDKRFRIGRALNPDVSPRHRDEEWVYSRIEEKCGSELARALWETWLHCRNQLFHYFPDNQRWLTVNEAARCIEMMAQTMELALFCQTRRRGQAPVHNEGTQSIITNAHPKYSF